MRHKKRKFSLKSERSDGQSMLPGLLIDLNAGGISKVMGEDEATGLADKAFSLACPCGVRLNHELLRMSKFRDDLVALKIEDVPMPGTLLNWDSSFDPIK